MLQHFGFVNVLCRVKKPRNNDAAKSSGGSSVPVHLDFLAVDCEVFNFCILACSFRVVRKYGYRVASAIDPEAIFEVRRRDMHSGSLDNSIQELRACDTLRVKVSHPNYNRVSLVLVPYRRGELPR